MNQDKKEAETIRNNLAALADSFDDNEISSFINGKNELEELVEETNYTDFVSMRGKIEECAETMIRSFMGLYFTEKEMEDPFLKQRFLGDSKVLANFLFYADALTPLFIQILDDMERNHKRSAMTIEALSFVQKASLENNVRLAEYINGIQNCYKRLQQDYLAVQTTQAEYKQLDDAAASIKSIGTKTIMDEVRQRAESQKKDMQ